MRIGKELRKLEERVSFIQMLAESLKSESRRIIKLGIMFNLLILVLNLSTLILNLNIIRKENIKPISGRSDERLDLWGIQNAKVENTLANIFEVVCPVGVYGVRLSAIPGSKPFLFCFLRSFGPLPGPSSEGFLVTLTPWWRRIVIFCDYTFVSENSRKYTHFQNPQRDSGKGNTPAREASTENLDVVEQQWQPPLVFDEPESPCGGSGASIIPLRQNPEGFVVRCTIIDSQETGLRHNLMMTSPAPGILVSLKPTDEVLRKDRNSKVTDENRERA